PESQEQDCCHPGEAGSATSHSNRISTGRPPTTSSASKTPWRPANRPRTGVSSTPGTRLEPHQLLHVRDAGSNGRSVNPSNGSPDTSSGTYIRSTWPAAPRIGCLAARRELHPLQPRGIGHIDQFAHSAPA